MSKVNIDTIVTVGNMVVRTCLRMFKVSFGDVSLSQMTLTEMIDLRDALDAMIKLQGES